MNVFRSDKDTAKLYIQFVDQITQNLNISARMSWSLSEILKLFKKLAGQVLSGIKTLNFTLSF